MPKEIFDNMKKEETPGKGKKSLKATRKQWIKCIVVVVLYLAFLYWIKSWWGLLAVPFIVDAYITKLIPWSWWKNIKSGFWRSVMSWVDAIVFALVGVYFANLYWFQNYTIPSSSLEKSLLVGDYLYVSKVAYGPRKPITPLTMPLTQHTMPKWLGGGKSYLDRPQWDYKRVKGWGGIKQNDIVVFNYPTGDSIFTNPQYQAGDYYKWCSDISASIHEGYPVTEGMSAREERQAYERFLADGRNYVAQHPEVFGTIDHRPVDRRENYVKRCVGLPGQTLEIRDKIVYLDGVANKEPDNVQYFYQVTTTRPITEKIRRSLGISVEDLRNHNAAGTVYGLPLTEKMIAALQKYDFVTEITPMLEKEGNGLYPLNKHTGWSIDNYGPIWIPAKGTTVELSLDNLPFYERPIGVYEGNELVVKDSTIYINGEPTTSYTFKMDYYWMQGDNRHNSLDSRYWGFVPEDHIVGKPRFIWLSLDKDVPLFQGKVRWKRLFTPVSKYN